MYLGSTISDSELHKCIGKAATTFSRLTKRVWSDKMLTEHTKIQVYTACVVSTLLYGSESWILRARQERKLKVFQLGYLRRILNITWQDKVSNKTILERAETPSMYTLLKQRRLRWLGHVVRMDDSRIPKDLLYEELVQGKRPAGRLQLSTKMSAKGIRRHSNLTSTDGKSWPLIARLGGLSQFEEALALQTEAKRQRRTDCICSQCERDCHSRIGLSSHTRRCSRATIQSASP